MDNINKQYDASKIAIITCANDDEMYDEAVRYINKLHVPVGMSVDLLKIVGAGSMTEGYQAAMESSDAKYKLYMHQDCLVINKNILQDVIKLFQAHPDVGLIGLAGCQKLPGNGPVWWSNKVRLGMNVTKHAPEFGIFANFGAVQGEFQEADILDGFFLATQYDLPWRTDLFTGWHFYDVSQTREFINAGYKAVVAHQDESWIVHCSGRKVIDNSYYRYQKIFEANYRLS